ncbi:protein DD3-3-like [Styela clava]
MTILMKFSLLILVMLEVCLADIYMHNPRGSNNRHKGSKRDTDNQARLFDSQNNARGGYNVGEQSMYYYNGTTLQIQWSNQHSCGDENNNCEIIIQYMCGNHLRDGTTGNTICRNPSCDTDQRFGQHENLRYYEKCAARERNKGLFKGPANHQVRISARSTRQNRDGDRRGLECPEERDYYPYWGASPWKDIVVFTNDPTRCEKYKEESQNEKGRYECDFPEEYWQVRKRMKIVLFGDKEKCEASTDTVDNVTYRGEWKWVPSHGIGKPECYKSIWSRDNHQGNTVGGYFAKYDWTIPDLAQYEEKCVLRIRYNISTNDFDSWNTFGEHNDNTLALQSIYSEYGFSEREARKRGYVYQNDPKLDVFATYKREKKFQLQIAVNVAQFGRTFQDRSHVFYVHHRPIDYVGETIHNLNVRGKRGNLQQVFPATEYDFVPNVLKITKGDLVHFQWTGSDSNPANNAGNGEAQTDRSNIAQLAQRTFPKGDDLTNNTLKTNYPAFESEFLGFSRHHVDDLAFLKCKSDGGTLDDREAYFDLGPQTVESIGNFYYFSTRNNQFTNRAQKASILVGEDFYTDRGVSYRGYKSVTESGIKCQRWDSQTPHTHDFNPENHVEHNLVENYCRNPNNRWKGPWCFTTDPNTKWEFCGLTKKRNADASRKRREADIRDTSLGLRRIFPTIDKDPFIHEGL